MIDTFGVWRLRSGALVGLGVLLMLSGIKASAQAPVLDVAGVPTIVRNSTANMHAQGDSLWVGSFLSLTADGGNTWQIAEADSLFDTRNSVFSIDVEGDVIWVGLGFHQYGR